jgi:hypothetical protein
MTVDETHAPTPLLQSSGPLSVGQIFEELIPDLFTWIGENIQGLLMTVAVYFATIMVVTMGVVVTMLILLAGGAVASAGVFAVVDQVASEEMASMTLMGLILFGYALYFAFMMFFSACLSLLPAGVLKTLELEPGRAMKVWALAPFACFNLRDAKGVIVSQFLVALAVLVGFLCCILPGLVVGMASFFVMPAVVLDGLGPVAAIRRAWGHFADHVLWHLVMLVCNMAAMIAVSFLPFVGHVAAPVLGAVVVWRFYRTAFPAGASGGETPRLEVKEPRPDASVEDEGLAEE